MVLLTIKGQLTVCKWECETKLPRNHFIKANLSVVDE